MPTTPKNLVLNGVRARGGGYALSLTTSVVKDLALGKTLDQTTLNELKRKKAGDARGFGFAAKGLPNEGWGVILPAALPPNDLHARLDALGELLDLRLAAAGGRFKIFCAQSGYRPGESKRDWLTRLLANPDGTPNPDAVPVYLLIAASPEEIPYSFQYQLDVQYRTGRLYFQELDGWAIYAHSVVEVEKGGFRLPPQAGVFATANPDDEATKLSSDNLAEPLGQYLLSRFRLRSLKEKILYQIGQKGLRFSLEPRDYTEAELAKINQDLKLGVSFTDVPGWQVSLALREQASRLRLEGLMGGADTPALLFSATHGMVFDAGDPFQEPHQGALLCQDWKGPNGHVGDIGEELYFAGDHLSSDAHLKGMVAFFFACYGAGTPRYDEFITSAGMASEIAQRSFTASLPVKLLSHPHGSALAVIGHVERAWSYSFMTEDNRPQLNVFETAFGNLMQGRTVGEAMDTFNRRYAELATDINDIQNNARFPGYILDELKLSDLWVAQNDARNTVVLGDPAVCLPIADQPQEATERTYELFSPGQRPPLSDGLRKSIEAAAGPAPAVEQPIPPVVPPPQPAEPQPPPVTGPQVDYSIFGKNFDQAQRDFAASLKEFVDQMSAYVGKLAQEVSELKVETYIAPDLTQVDARGRAQAASPVARTIISLTGDTRLEVSPETTPEQNQLHLEMVQKTQENRMELLKTLAGALVGLKDLLKP